jgi:hypothetical protein
MQMPHVKGSSGAMQRSARDDAQSPSLRHGVAPVGSRTVHVPTSLAASSITPASNAPASNVAT